jgi:SAM-dependent methyltransferase
MTPPRITRIGPPTPREYTGSSPVPSRAGRLAFPWADITSAPLHDFPLRDEILFQYLPFSAHFEVLEVGPGSGYTAFRLAPHVRDLTVLDVSNELVRELRIDLVARSNIRFVVADLSRPGLTKTLPRVYDVAFGLDVFEYLANPATALLNLGGVLRPGGELFLTFPNVPPPAGDGVAYFAELSDLEHLLGEAGFRSWDVFAVRLRPFARFVYGTLHEWPLRLYRRLRRRAPVARPQTYDGTWAFRNRRDMGRYRVLIHLAWAALALVLRLGGNVFVAERVNGAILGRQLVIRART